MVKRLLFCSLWCCLVCNRGKSGIVDYGILIKPQKNIQVKSIMVMGNEYVTTHKAEQFAIEILDKDITVLKQGLGAVRQY